MCDVVGRGESVYCASGVMTVRVAGGRSNDKRNVQMRRFIFILVQIFFGGHCECKNSKVIQNGRYTASAHVQMKCSSECPKL